MKRVNKQGSRVGERQQNKKESPFARIAIYMFFRKRIKVTKLFQMFHNNGIDFKIRIILV